MIEREPGAVVRAHLDAFSAGDLDRMLATLAPRAHFMSGTTVVDPAQFPDFFGSAIRELSPRMHVDDVLVDGDRVACQFIESITADGRRQHLSRAAFYRVADGLITWAKVYDERE
jgi:ketosteroid isomerase-like protein